MGNITYYNKFPAEIALTNVYQVTKQTIYEEDKWPDWFKRAWNIHFTSLSSIYPRYNNINEIIHFAINICEQRDPLINKMVADVINFGDYLLYIDDKIIVVENKLFSELYKLNNE